MIFGIISVLMKWRIIDIPMMMILWREAVLLMTAWWSIIIIGIVDTNEIRIDNVAASNPGSYLLFIGSVTYYWSEAVANVGVIPDILLSIIVVAADWRKNTIFASPMY